MKIIHTLILVITLLLSQTSFAKELKIHVNGMVCAFCAQGIIKTFRSRSEVLKIDVNLNDKIVTISTKEGQELSDADIRSLLQDAGFAVESIERK